MCSYEGVLLGDWLKVVWSPKNALKLQGKYDYGVLKINFFIFAGHTTGKHKIEAEQFSRASQ